MVERIAFIGFGEAGQAFALPGARAYDIKTDGPATRSAKYADYRAAGVEGCDRAAQALADAAVVFSLVTADQALAAARDGAGRIPADSLWLDMNSAAPGTKRAAADAIHGGGGRYIDVAVMAPVHPAGFDVPLLVAGPYADAGARTLRGHGFGNVAIAGPKIGDASAIKMIRSVMVKGMEALCAECALAAHRAGVSDAVFASLDASWKPQGWVERIDNSLDRMLVHGLRRAAEMEEVAITLDDLGVAPAMTSGTIIWQRAIGTLGLMPPPGLAAKLAAIDTGRGDIMPKEQVG